MIRRRFQVECHTQDLYRIWFTAKPIFDKTKCSLKSTAKSGLGWLFVKGGSMQSFAGWIKKAVFPLGRQTRSWKCLISVGSRNESVISGITRALHLNFTQVKGVTAMLAHHLWKSFYKQNLHGKTSSDDFYLWWENNIKCKDLCTVYKLLQSVFINLKIFKFTVVLTEKNVTLFDF